MAGPDGVAWWSALLQENALVGVVLFIAVGICWLARRFFSADRGIFTLWAKENSAQNAQVVGMQGKIVMLQERQGELAIKLGLNIDQAVDSLQKIEERTQATQAGIDQVREAARESVDILACVLETHGVQCQRECDSIKRKLEER